MSAIGTDPQDVIKILGSIVSGQDVGGALSRVLQKAFGEESSANSVRALAADLVHLGAVYDHDWETIITSIKVRLSYPDLESQIFALNLIPSIPTRFLDTLVIKDGLGDFMVACFSDANPSIRSATISAFGHLLTQSSLIQKLSEQHPDKTQSYKGYWQSICDGIVDPENEVSAAAFSAISLLMKQHMEAMKSKSSASSPSAILRTEWHSFCTQSLERNLSAVVHRAQELDPDGVSAAIEIMCCLAADFLLSDREEKTVEGDGNLWVVPVIGHFLELQLSAVDSTVAAGAAKSLLELCKNASENISRSWGVSTSASLSAWSFKAITTLYNLWESKESIPARSQIALTICRHLKQLETSEIGTIAKLLLQRISLLPHAKDRIQALMSLWKAVLESDLRMRKIRHSRGDIIPGVSLQHILESPFFSAVVAGNVKQQVDLQLSRAIQKASYPAYKQELVCTLIKVILEHSRNYDFESIFPAMDEESKELNLNSAIQSDAQSDVTDWFAASVVALYLSQACLGWENIVSEGHYGLILPSDLWLQQLQLTSQTLYVILNHFGVKSFSQLRGLDEESSKTRKGKLLTTFAGEAFEIQKLMKRMVFFWSFLSDALKPRIFWIVCHHIELPDRVEDVWTHLKDSLKDLMITRPTELTRRQQQEQINAAKDGRLASNHDSIYELKSSSSDNKLPGIALDQSEVALEGLTVGLACLNLLTETLMNQYTFVGFPYYYDGVKKIAVILKEVCNQVLEEDFVTVDMFDQFQLILKQLDHLIETAPEGYELVETKPTEEKSSSQNHEQGITFLPEDLSAKVHEGYPFATSKSLAYATTKRSKRYKLLHDKLHAGSKPLQKNENSSPPIPLKPSAVELASAVGGLDLEEHDQGWKILTGQGDPVQLSLRHQVDVFQRNLKLEMRAENKIGSDITGLVLSLAIEGPVATYREGMIVWHPEKLQANEPVMHEVQLGLNAFGAVEIQPFMDVSLQGIDEDFPSLSCSAYNIPLIDLIVPTTAEITPKTYFQEMCSWPDSTNMTAVCRWPGTNGGMQLLSALNKTKLKKVWPKKRNSLNFFQAIYLAQTYNGSLVSLSITGQLVDLKQMGLAAWAITPDEERPAGNVGYYLCKCTFASSSAKVIVEIRSKMAKLLSDLTNGGLIPGLDPGVGKPPAPPPICPDVHVQIDVPQGETFTTDLQSLALQEWKRWNGQD